MMPRSKDGHYSLYMMNHHRHTIDIHDTRKYTSHPDVTTKWRRTDYHSDCTEVVCHFSCQVQSFFVFILLNFFINCTCNVSTHRTTLVYVVHCNICVTELHFLTHPLICVKKEIKGNDLTCFKRGTVYTLRTTLHFCFV